MLRRLYFQSFGSEDALQNMAYTSWYVNPVRKAEYFKPHPGQLSLMRSVLYQEVAAVFLGQDQRLPDRERSEEHTSELQSLS